MENNKEGAATVTFSRLFPAKLFNIALENNDPDIEKHEVVEHLKGYCKNTFAMGKVFLADLGKMMASKLIT
ncbi:hypothetical protein FNH22_31035 [Fulvivirga sp. M361]|uniref:hypothetical protein n=1 Tax=Fulvivirga sp. M361 TaxID=2594266 RepID=UPI00117AA9D7|nr:hypothetical protein [Fulvivirga sp. M361]TRX46363.1 hypothetical protein FNH22_31035 [Fulvivirga sp. M361]